MKAKHLLTSLALALTAALPALASATTYPLTVTDIDQHQVTIEHEPQRIILQDGRDILSLALLDRDDPFKRVVAWNNLPKKQDSETWDLLRKKWPEAEKILDMGFSDQGEVNLETVIARHPDLMIAQLRAKPALEQTGVLRQLAALKIPVLFVDDELHAVKDTAASIRLLGKVLNQEANANAYADYYDQHLQRITQTAEQASKKPLVFIEPIAGITEDACCFTHSHSGWGGLVEAAGGKNIGSELLPGAVGFISPEKIISLNPDFYIMTGSKRGGKGSGVLPFGYNTDSSAIKATFERLSQRNGVKEVPAVKQGHVFGLYHHFYNHPYNIVGLELLSKAFYPQQMADVDPLADYHYIIRTFTHLPDAPINLSYSVASKP
ncbi:ABC transporter substrate-binding protein [Pantoea sp. A4]|uniref:ABC transporter substrate-binding protein n=1 Tax=Pantoea sp. A4 TaxID=1225184 RepID=UPI00036FB5BF|nr:ABC transporter substrate-binding protein [Pantoea sp. A4]